METKLISIIIPVYNTEKYIKRCLESVIAQTYSNLEIIVVDDGSKDRSSIIIDDYAKKDNRIKPLHIENHGVSYARNYALKHIHGEYVTFLDSDDYLPIDSIEIRYKGIDKNIDAVFGGFKICGDNSNGKEIKVKQEQIISLDYNIGISSEYGIASVWGGLFFAKLFNNITFSEKLYVGEDLMVINQIYLKCRLVKIVPNIIYYYQENEVSATKKPFTERRYTEVYAREGVAEMYENYPKIQKEYWGMYLRTCISQYCFILKSGLYESEYLLDLLKRMRKKIRYLFYINNRKSLMYYLIIVISPKLFMRLYKWKNS